MPMPLQKPGRSKQNYGTPKDFIKAALWRLNIQEFVHDFAADEYNRVSACTWFDADFNALREDVDWVDYVPEGEWGWLNPPFNNIAPWAKRCAELKQAGGQVAFLVPASVDANWYRDHVHGQALVLALNGRLAFMPDKPTWMYPKGCVLCLYSPRISPGFDVWDWRKTVV